ncbi:MAG: hypothetical protein ABI868_23565 [Acidobacteriota bacterium]
MRAGDLLVLRVLRVLCALCALIVWAVPADAQPDPRQMAGIPRPVTDLPDGAVSVRLIRGQLSNNIPDFPVELQVGSEMRTGKTDDMGRAEFTGLPAGAMLKAVAVVDGERLESETFPAPARGGIRLLLVATNKGEAAPAASVPAVAGQVAIGGQSRIIIQPGEETVEVYYLLDIINAASGPVNPPAPFVFDMPSGATGTGILEGSSPNASAKDRQVTVQGPFPSGRTLVQVGAAVPAGQASLHLTQRFPVAVDQLAVVVKKVGGVTLASPQLSRQQEMTASGETYIAGTGGAVPVGQPIELTLDNLPHHSGVARWVALSLTGMIIVFGVWLSRGPGQSTARGAERKRMVARRDKLFNDLVRLEHDHRNGKINEGRYATRREDIVGALEHIYGALDEDEIGPEPADRSGVAA